MKKFFLSFAACFAFASTLLAVDVEIVPAHEPEEDSSQPWVISFDGKTEVKAKLIEKIIACHDKFSPANKEHLNDMLAHRGGVADLKESLKNLKRTPASTEQITLSNRELSGTFVETTFKECLSK